MSLDFDYATRVFCGCAPSLFVSSCVRKQPSQLTHTPPAGSTAKPFHIENFSLAHTEGLSVLEFATDSAVTPPFLVDHGRVLARAEGWVEASCNNAISPLCVINGLVKTGKSAVLTAILPQLIQQHSPQALICHLDFNRFINVQCSRPEAAGALLWELREWAVANGIPTPLAVKWETYEHLTAQLRALMSVFRDSGRTIYFLIDEVQRWFQVQEPDYVLFKSLINVCGLHRKSLRFALTGSGMVQAWQGMIACPANGTTVVAESWVINLPAADSPALLQFAATRLIQHFGDDVAGRLGDLLAPALSLADMSYRANLWASTAPDERTPQEVSLRCANKRHEEFCTDMLPLLDRLRKQPNGKILLCLMRALASKEGTPKDPRSWLPDTQQSLYQEHFRHFVEHTHSGFHFHPSSFSELLLKFITTDGETCVPAPTDVRLFAYRKEQLDSLCELVARAGLKRANTILGQDKFLDAMEKEAAVHFARHGWVISPNFAKDYDVDKVPSSSADRALHGLLVLHNDGIIKRFPRTLPRPYSAFLLADRNAIIHYAEAPNPEQRLLQIVMDCAPPGIGNLVASLQDAVKKQTGKQPNAGRRGVLG
jgi:hypothetical protein